MKRIYQHESVDEKKKHYKESTIRGFQLQTNKQTSFFSTNNNNNIMQGQDERIQGRVKWFNKNNGIGFIRNLATQQDIFVHHSELAPKTDCFRFLTEGEYVEYSEGPATQPHSTQAKQVTGIAGNELLCEVRRVAAGGGLSGNSGPSSGGNYSGGGGHGGIGRRAPRNNNSGGGGGHRALPPSPLMDIPAPTKISRSYTSDHYNDNNNDADAEDYSINNADNLV